MTMFGTLVQRLTSPVTSPTSPRRRFKSPSRWEVQSDPEDDPAAPVRKSRAKHLLDKRKSKSRARALNVHSEQVQMCNSGWHDAAFPPLRGTKSLGRLDGMKEVSLRSLFSSSFFFLSLFATLHLMGVGFLVLRNEMKLSKVAGYMSKFLRRVVT